jgi:single-strand DNA-binding protein
MFNKVILVGRLTRDVELKYLPSGTSVATFGLAASRTWKDKNTSENKEEVMFIDIDSFGRSAEIANQYLKKGSKVLVEGRIVQDRWTDQQGQNRSKHKIMAENIKFMDTKAEAQSYQSSQQNASQNAYSKPSSAPTNDKPYTQPTQEVKQEVVPEIDIDDDDVPF